METAISVIVPIYNVEKYLKECIDSLVNQTFSDYEVILVDDGSTDGGSDIARRCADNYEFIKYFYKENGGQSSARNFGLEKAVGKYVMFVDSDDYIDSDALRVLYEKAEANNLDIVRGKFFNCHEDGKTYENCGSLRIVSTNVVMTGQEYLYTSFLNRAYDVIPVVNLIKKEYLEKHNIRFIEGYYFEDHLYTLQLLFCAERVMQTEYAFYFYRHRANSTTTVIDIKKCFDLLAVMQKMLEYLDGFTLDNEGEFKKYPVISHSMNILIQMYECLPKGDKNIVYRALDSKIKCAVKKYPTQDKYRNIQNRLFIISPTLEELSMPVLSAGYRLIKKMKKTEEINFSLMPRNNFELYSDVKSTLVWGEHAVEPPFLTVSIPAYKRGDLLKEALESILCQKDSPSLEIVISDDEPCEAQEETQAMRVVKKLNDTRIVLYHNESNLGLCANWNRSVFLARSEYVCALDDDDLLEETYFSEVYRILTAHPQIDMLGTKWSTLDQRKSPPQKEKTDKALGLFVALAQKTAKNSYEKLTPVNRYLVYPHIVLLMSGAIIRKSFALKLGGFNDDWFPSMDYAFLANATRNINVFVYNKKLATTRILSNTSAKPDSVRGFCVSDFKIHECMKNYYPFWMKPFISLSNRVMVKSQLDGLNSFWGTNVLYDEVAKELGIGRFFSSAFAKRLYKLFMKSYSLYKLHYISKHSIGI